MLNPESIRILFYYKHYIDSIKNSHLKVFLDEPDFHTLFILRVQYFKDFYELNKETVDQIYYDLFVEKTRDPAHSIIQKAFVFTPNADDNEDRLIQAILFLDGPFYDPENPDNPEISKQRDLLFLALGAFTNWNSEKMPKYYSEYPGKLYEGENIQKL